MAKLGLDPHPAERGHNKEDPDENLQPDWGLTSEEKETIKKESQNQVKTAAYQTATSEKMTRFEKLLAVLFSSDLGSQE